MPATARGPAGIEAQPSAANRPLNVLDDPLDAARAADLRLADHCRLNPLWLHMDLPGRRALEVAVPGYDLGPALADLFATVDASTSVPSGTAAYDLVTLYGRRAADAELVAIRRLLAVGGTALLGVANRWYRGLPGRSAQGAATGDSLELVARLGRAGFSRACAYWVEPTLATPRNLIPTAADSVRVYESMRASEFGHDRLRVALRRLWLTGLLYPALVVVASR